MNGLNSALFNTLSLPPLFPPSFRVQCPAVLVYIYPTDAHIMPKITLSLPRAMTEIRAKERMPKALCGPAFHDHQVTNHTPIQAPGASLLFIQQNSSPFWHLKVFAHPLAPNKSPFFAYESPRCPSPPPTSYVSFSGIGLYVLIRPETLLPPPSGVGRMRSSPTNVSASSSQKL